MSKKFRNSNAVSVRKQANDLSIIFYRSVNALKILNPMTAFRAVSGVDRLQNALEQDGQSRRRYNDQRAFLGWGAYLGTAIVLPFVYKGFVGDSSPTVTLGKEVLAYTDSTFLGFLAHFAACTAAPLVYLQGHSLYQTGKIRFKHAQIEDQRKQSEQKRIGSGRNGPF